MTPAHLHIVRLALLLLLAASCSIQAAAQRRITPVDQPKGITERTERPFDRSHLKEVTDAQGNVVLVDTVSGAEVVDSTAMPKVKPNIYPLMHNLSIGVNVMDGIMRILGQQYGLASVKAQLSLHNRYMPFLEMGLSAADFTPDGNNYTFHSPTAPFFKIGAGYNVFYNSNDAYNLCVNLAYGFSNFSYRYRDVTIDEGYWQSPSHPDLPSQRVTTGYLEVGASVKVRIAGPVSAGWSVVYHKRLHESSSPYGPPVVVPGFGKRDGALAVNFYFMYTIGLNKRRQPEVNPSDQNIME